MSSKKVPSTKCKMCRFTSSCTCAVSSCHLLSIETFFSIQWFCLQTVKVLIRPRGCAGCLGLRCRHILKNTFLHGVSHFNVLIGWKNLILSNQISCAADQFSSIFHEKNNNNNNKKKTAHFVSTHENFLAEVMWCVHKTGESIFSGKVSKLQGQ